MRPNDYKAQPGGHLSIFSPCLCEHAPRYLYLSLRILHHDVQRFWTRRAVTSVHTQRLEKLRRDDPIARFDSHTELAVFLLGLRIFLRSLLLC